MVDLVSLINLLFATQCGLDPRGSYQDNYYQWLQNGASFDYIVVGGGSAGSVVAGRLSEHRKATVLVLEAGGYPTADTEIPLLYMSKLVNSEMDWKYEMEKSPVSCLGYENQTCRLSRGKVLGGTGTINGMVYVKGMRKDYDAWADQGNPGWEWYNIVRYFRRSQRIVNREGDYGTDGPITLTYTKSTNPLRDVVLDAAREANFDVHEDERDVGFFEYLSNVENGKRCSPSKAFLARNYNRKNLYVAVTTHVTKVLFEKNKAVGVEVNVDGDIFNVYATKEVVISAGVIGSPKLLMLSGIGPKDHLIDLGIPIIKDLPVGKNYQDHTMLFGLMAKMEAPPREKTDPCITAMEYCASKTGLYAGHDNLNIMWSLSTTNDTITPDIHIIPVPYPKNSVGPIRTRYEKHGINSITVNSAVELTKQHDLLVYLVWLGAPKSRGELLLRSKYPFDPPRIYTKILTDEGGEDLKVLRNSIKVIQRTLDTPTMRKYKAEFARLDIPNCKNLEFDTDAYWDCHIHNLANTNYHTVGTCKMGPKEDKSAVVDARLRVHGISNLRIIDASMMPTIVSRNTHAATLMIAEKGADMMNEDAMKAGIRW